MEHVVFQGHATGIQTDNAMFYPRKWEAWKTAVESIFNTFTAAILEKQISPCTTELKYCNDLQTGFLLLQTLVTSFPRKQHFTRAV